MARTPKPLSVLVHPDLWDTPQVQELIEKGHEVVAFNRHDDLVYSDGQGHEGVQMSLEAYDLILSPQAWRIIPSLTKHIGEAVKAARSKKYPTKKKGS